MALYKFIDLLIDITFHVPFLLQSHPQFVYHIRLAYPALISGRRQLPCKGKYS